MALSVAGFQAQMRGIWGGLSASKRVALLAVSGVVLAAFLALIVWGGRPTYRVLFAGLSQEDAASIVERLKEKKVPYRLAGGGAVIEVPEERLYELRLELAAEGIPQGGGIGFEIFDRNSFGSTEFVQRVNLQRALQGELARTIRQFPQVANARVHISMPEQSLFVRESEQPRATVVLQLKPGAVMQPSQLQGIVHLVASGVQAMPEQNVHIVDTSGKVLYSPRNDQEMGMISGSALELQREMEQRLESKIIDILEPIVGPDRVVARVSVELDTRKVEETEEQYDPDKAAVRSEQRTVEKSNGTAAEEGIPGVRSNTGQPGTPAVAASPVSSLERENETVNYELSRMTRRTVSPMGRIQRLTVSVIVDGTRERVAGKKGEESRTVKPRSPEELKQFEDIVKQAVGFDPHRGDQMRIASAPFIETHAAEEMTQEGWQQGVGSLASSPILRYGVVLALALIFVLLVVRPLVKGILSAMPPPSHQVDLREPDRIPPGDRPAALPEEEPGSVPEQLAKAAEENPERFASALKAWLGQEN